LRIERGSWGMRWCKWGRLGGVAEGTGGLRTPSRPFSNTTQTAPFTPPHPPASPLYPQLRRSWGMRWCKWGRLGGVAEGTGGSTEIRMAFGGCWEVPLPVHDGNNKPPKSHQLLASSPPAGASPSVLPIPGGGGACGRAGSQELMGFRRFVVAVMYWEGDCVVSTTSQQPPNAIRISVLPPVPSATPPRRPHLHHLSHVLGGGLRSCG
jgi:hypothetical protein